MRRVIYLVSWCVLMSLFACTNKQEQKEDTQKAEPKIERFLLTDQGGDRATAYTMNNKILHLKEGILCTWIDKGRQNRWCLLSPDGKQKLREGKIGEERDDNHCGASLALAPDGRVHVVLGGHHSQIDHYSIGDIQNEDWRYEGGVDAPATYPSLISDDNGTLHMAFRHQTDSLWVLSYCSYKDGAWSEPKGLVKAAKSGYVYWTNVLAKGKNNKVHLAFANVRELPDGRLYHGTSHLFSNDQGETWSTGVGDLSDFPVSARDIPLMQGEEKEERIASLEYLEEYAPGGPTSKEYLQMILSNVVVDEEGMSHMVVHNGIDGSAELFSQAGSGWSAQSLMPQLKKQFPDFRVHVQSSLSIRKDGSFLVCLMLEPTQTNTWGPPGTFVMVLDISKDRKVKLLPITNSVDTLAQWLPAFGHISSLNGSDKTPLLFTEGRNAGGFSANKNELATKVWCVYIPD